MIAINAGGSATTLSGVQYQEDRFSDGGTPNSTSDPIAGTTEDTPFQSARYGSYSYEIPISNAFYSVKLHFVELHQTAAGALSFNAVVISDGKLTIGLETLADNANLPDPFTKLDGTRITDKIQWW